MSTFKLGCVARLSIENPTALDNPIVHKIPTIMMTMQGTDSYMPTNQRWMRK